ncbi:MAG: 3-oxoacid CoA-transferase subunit A [Gammaproteobacteria bacterium]
MDKPTLTPAQAAALLKPGQSIIVGGFGLTGYPIRIVNALAESGVSDITYISNNVGEPGHGGGRMLRNGQLKKVVGTFFTNNPEVYEAQQAGKLDVELIPQGNLAEALRAGGAGLGGFYTPTSAGTVLAEGKEQREINGRQMVLVAPITADVA